MDSEFLIGLGNNDSGIRKKAQSDFIGFWDEQAKNLQWFRKWDKTLDWNFPFARWFVGGTLNASFNTLDIHKEKRPEKPAILWEGENGDSRILSYQDLWFEVNKFANALKSLGVKKGDRVTISPVGSSVHPVVDTKVTPDGRVSVTITPVASEGPLLRTVTV